MHAGPGGVEAAPVMLLPQQQCLCQLLRSKQQQVVQKPAPLKRGFAAESAKAPEKQPQNRFVAATTLLRVRCNALIGTLSAMRCPVHAFTFTRRNQ